MYRIHIHPPATSCMVDGSFDVNLISQIDFHKAEYERMGCTVWVEYLPSTRNDACEMSTNYNRSQP
jgi:hypothetical protein